MHDRTTKHVSRLPVMLAAHGELAVWHDLERDMVISQIGNGMIAMSPDEFIRMFAPAVKDAVSALSQTKVIPFGRATQHD